MTKHRHVRLFRTAATKPVEFELPGNEAIMHRDGDRLMIEPPRKHGLVALLKSMKPLEDDFPATSSNRGEGVPGRCEAASPGPITTALGGMDSGFACCARAPE